MDAMTAHLVDFALQSRYSQFSETTVHECKRRIIDTFACAVGAYDEPLSCMARAVAERCTGTPSATVWGSTHASTPEAAAFANGVMLRLDDISDNYRVKSGGHPSDLIAGIIAAGEAVHADGAAVIEAITIAYDVYCSFCESFDLNSKGWDQPVYGVLAGVLGIGKLLKLNREQMGHAVALALVPNMALFQTRSGELSSWKGCAGGNASRNALFAAFLARDGFTGPTAPFAGPAGLYDIVGRFDWQVVANGEVPHRVTQTHLKCYPVCGHGQSATQAAVEVHPRVRGEEISEVLVEVYRMGVEMMANDPSRWAPTTRETADHSLPYVVAVGLLDGEVVPRAFAPERLVDPAVTALMKKIKVAESPELSARFPESWSSRLRVRLASGNEITHEVRHPRGHVKDPLSDAQLEAKFRGMFRDYGDEAQCSAVLKALWNLNLANDVGQVLKTLVRRPAGSGSPASWRSHWTRPILEEET